MGKNFVSAVFDRKKKVQKDGLGKVEIHIYLSRNERKYITVKKCSPLEWERYQKDATLLAQIALYTRICESMLTLGEEMTIINFDKHSGLTPIAKKRQEDKRRTEKNGFINFMRDCLKEENIAASTRYRKKMVIDFIMDYGKLNTFADLTERNIRDFNDHLNDGTREECSIYNYHKVLKKYCRLAFEKDFIDVDPYSKCHFSKGKTKEREPLEEYELKKLMKLTLNPKLDKARDLFIFCSYTGLSYADTQIFDFKAMTDCVKKKYFIDGSRVKTGEKYYTPILPPAMKVLEKYNYQLPKISNQKLNDYLHVLEGMIGTRKSMTCHVARHSFATLCLDYDISLEDIKKMLGHRDIKTTQIYAVTNRAKIRKTMSKIASRIR